MHNLFVIVVVAFSYYYEDPGGLIPSWVINWAAKVLTLKLLCIGILHLLHKKLILYCDSTCTVYSSDSINLYR